MIWLQANNGLSARSTQLTGLMYLTLWKDQGEICSRTSIFDSSQQALQDYLGAVYN